MSQRAAAFLVFVGLSAAILIFGSIGLAAGIRAAERAREV
jgi:hypothetical protein